MSTRQVLPDVRTSRAGFGFARTLVAGVLCATSLAAHAGLIGDTVTTQVKAGSYTTAAYTTVVGAGVEGLIDGALPFNYSDLGFTLDAGPNNTQLGPNIGVATVEVMLTGLDFGSDLLDVVFTSPLSGVTVSHNSHSVTFSWVEQNFAGGSRLIDAQFVVAAAGTLPEPVSVSLAGVALLAAGMARRRPTLRG